MKIKGYVWDATTGAAKSGVDVDLLKRNPSSAVVDSTTTASDGSFEFEENGNQYGVVDVKVDDAGSYRYMFGDVSLERMGYWDDAEMADLLMTISDGVVFGLDDEMDHSLPAGMTFRVGTGACKVDTALLRLYSAEDITVAANSTGGDRTDGVFARLARGGSAPNDEGIVELHYEAGSVTETDDADEKLVLLYTLVIPDGTSTLTGGMVTDSRPTATFPLANVALGDVGDGSVSEAEFYQLDGLDTNESLETKIGRLAKFTVTASIGNKSVAEPLVVGDQIAFQLPDVACDLEGLQIVVEGTGTPTCTVDIRGETYANWDVSGDAMEQPDDSIINTSGNTGGYGSALDASARTGTKPAVVTDGKVTVSTFTGWRTSFGAGDWLLVDVEAVSGVYWMGVALDLVKDMT